MITNHTQLINWLIAKHNLTSYCEIGTQNCNNNFHKIHSPVTSLIKVGVDPEPINGDNRITVGTSDEYFALNPPKMDIYFIDGYHECEQVKRDFENTLRCLNDNGFIVLHDTLPDEEQFTTVPRATKKWFGNVYLFATTLYAYGLEYVTLDMDCGCTVVRKKQAATAPKVPAATQNWEGYVKHGRELMNVIKPGEIENYF